jgi:glycosyltransferase involved in cell wall biosynthesis
MRICHVTPHLPPDQAANALLPVHLGEWAREVGDEPVYVAHYPRASGAARLPGPVEWMPPPPLRGRGAPLSQLGSLAGAAAIVRRASAVIESADLVHVHSNGLLAEVGAAIAARRRKPVVLTLYGTEIWHYRRKKGLDLFTRAYRQAAHVTFYSHGLHHRAQQLGLARRGTSVVYPPVAPAFRWHDAAEQARCRESLGIRNRHLIVNVKRLHPLAGQRFLLEAMNEVIRTMPDTRLVICGTGPLIGELRAAARAYGVEGHVSFTGLIDNSVIARYCAAADAFVLPSLLEACPTVAVEALASGTPVIGADNPGIVELNDLFGPDVAVVPREQPLPLARTIVELLNNKRRTMTSTALTIDRTFRPAAVAAQYRSVYRQALEQPLESAS